MGRYRKEEKLNKLLDNFYEAQIRFNKSEEYYGLEIYCDYDEHRNILIHFYFHNLKNKQYTDLRLKEYEFIECKLWDEKTCYYIINQLFVNVKLLCGWFE